MYKRQHGPNTQTTQTAIGQWNPGDTYWSWCGFMDDFKISTGFAADTWTANTVIERYQAGRAGNHLTANSSTVFYLKSNTTYGDTAFTDSIVPNISPCLIMRPTSGNST